MDRPVSALCTRMHSSRMHSTRVHVMHPSAISEPQVTPVGGSVEVCVGDRTRHAPSPSAKFPRDQSRRRPRPPRGRHPRGGLRWEAERESVVAPLGTVRASWPSAGLKARPLVRLRAHFGWRGESPLRVNVTRNRLQLRRRETGWGAAGGERPVRRITNSIRPVRRGEPASEWRSPEFPLGEVP
jgi:hypothetical protein